MQGVKVQGVVEENKNMRGENECRDAGHHHAAFKQDGHTIHAIVKGIVRLFGKIAFLSRLK